MWGGRVKGRAGGAAL
ncbi:hypothetical protein Tco_1302605, partial [Tanacetum coccineum]